MAGTSATFTWSPGSAPWSTGCPSGPPPGGSDVYSNSQAAEHLRHRDQPAGRRRAGLRPALHALRAGWQFTDYTYTAATATKAALTSPATGSTLTGTSVTFTWSPGVGALEYRADRRDHRRGAATSTPELPGAQHLRHREQPADRAAAPIYVRLYTRFALGWQFTDYTYTAATASKAALTSPAPEQHLDGHLATSSPGARGSAPWSTSLFVGTTPGGQDVYM